MADWLASFNIFSLRALTFVWPSLLWLLAIVPALLWFYLRINQRRQRIDTRFAALLTSQQGAGAPRALGGWRGALDNHTPAILWLLALCALIAVIARPHAMIVLPSRVDAIILALDASGSMRATDVKPNRLAAAQAAAKAFIAQQPSQVRIGVVSIAATANLIQAPTDKRDDIVRAIERVQLQPGSALGSGIVIALTTLLPTSGIDADKFITGKPPTAGTRDWSRQAEIFNFKPVPPGSNSAAAIVLISDGEANTGADLMEAGKLAAQRGVRIYTVGVGTAEGAVLSVEGWSMRSRLDEAGLRKLADMTRGEYLAASNASELSKVYQVLSARLAMGKGRETEITALFVALGTLLAVFAALLSMLRSNRIL